MQGTQRVVAKHALILMGRGNTEIASQIFVYDHMREIRADLETFEVKVLMDYDTAYHRVFKVEVNENISKEQATKLVLDFYNNLLNASMKLSDEERENILAQRKAQAEKVKATMEARANVSSEEVKEETTSEEIVEEDSTKE